MKRARALARRAGVTGNERDANSERESAWPPRTDRPQKHLSADSGEDPRVPEADGARTAHDDDRAPLQPQPVHSMHDLMPRPGAPQPRVTDPPPSAGSAPPPRGQ